MACKVPLEPKAQRGLKVHKALLGLKVHKALLVLKDNKAQPETKATKESKGL